MNKNKLQSYLNPDKENIELLVKSIILLPKILREIAFEKVNHSMNKHRIFPRTRTNSLLINILNYIPLRLVLIFSGAMLKADIQKSLPEKILTSDINFLAEALSLTLSSDCDYRTINSIIEKNIDWLDYSFANRFRKWSNYQFNRFSLKTKPISQTTILMPLYLTAIGNFSLSLLQFPKGSQDTNTEIAIAGLSSCLDFARSECDEYQSHSIFFYKLDFSLPFLSHSFNELHLGLAYIKRVKGYKQNNIRQAAKYLENALSSYLQEGDKQLLALTYCNLAVCYLEYKNSKNKRDSNKIEKSIKYLKKALEIYDMPIHARIGGTGYKSKWASTHRDLGMAYSKREKGLKEQNIKKAINHFQEALRIYNRKTYPGDWAYTQSLLGHTYNKLQQVTQAIQCFQAAWEVFTPTEYPRECIEIGRNMGNVAFAIEMWQEAIRGYAKSIEAVEQNRSWFASELLKQKLQEDTIDIYDKMVQAHMNTGQLDKAIEYVERSKSRNLVELLDNKNLYPKCELYANPEAYQIHCDKLEKLRREISAKQRQVEILSQQTEKRYYDDEILISTLKPQDKYSTYVESLWQELNHLRQNRNKLLEQINQVDSSFTFTQKVEPIPFSDIQALTDENTAIVQWYIMGSQILTFIITRHNLHPIVVPSSPENLKALEEWDKEYRDSYRQQKSQWITNLASRLQHLGEILYIDDVIARIDDIFKQKGARCDRLILIPHRYLHLFPLHALPLADGNLLLDRFPNGVCYAPSCQLLKLAKDQEQQRPHFSHLVAIQNPTRSRSKPLLGSKLEVNRICRHFDPDHSIVLAETEATEVTLSQRMDQLRSAHCVHFSCHGMFKPESPLESALLLADPEGKLGADANLTLGKIFEKLYLNQCRLVTFSACESGMTDPTSISDEYIGLPSGFLYAGSLSIVSTLWTVDPLATTLLMVKFYKNLKRFPELKAGDVALALKKAQTWLRTLTSKKLARIQNNPNFQRWVEQVFENLPKRDRKKFNELLDAAVKREPCPFANPYYWSCFVATGL